VGVSYAAVRWGSTTFIACYAPPRWDLATFETCLERMSAVVRGATAHSLIVAGDFNAKFLAWGCNTPNRRGEILLGWAVSLGLVVLNKGRASTCVRPQTESVVDVTFGSLWMAQKVKNWRVMRDEFLSDHLHIEVVIGNTRQQVRRPSTKGGGIRKGGPLPNWTRKPWRRR